MTSAVPGGSSPYASGRTGSRGFDFSTLSVGRGDSDGESGNPFSLTSSRKAWKGTRFSDDYADARELENEFNSQKFRNESYADAYRLAAMRRKSTEYGGESFGTGLAKGAATAAVGAAVPLVLGWL